MFIGVYNIANFITLLGLACALVSCVLAQQGHIKAAVCLFLISGLCDLFDGRVARSVGKRERKEKLFGVQIDTVCDMVSFGITPIVISYFCGFNRWYDMIVYIMYAAFAATRLAYFNTQAIEDTPDLNMKYFTGVPVTFSCLVLPPLMIFKELVNNTLAENIVFDLVILAIGIAFIINVKIKKLTRIQSICLVAFGVVCVLFMFVL